MTTANSTKVIAPKVRLSFVNLLEPKAFEGQEAKYSVMAMINKDDTKTLAKIEKAIDAAYQMGVDSGELKGVKRDKLKVTLRDADEEFDIEENPEFENHMFINLSAKQKPGVINKYKEKTTDPEEVYSGVYANVSMNFYPYNTAGNRGVSAGLNNVMVLGYGDYLGGRASAESDFAEFEAEDESEDLEDIL